MLKNSLLICGDTYKINKYIKKLVSEVFENNKPWVAKYNGLEMQDLSKIIEEIRTIPIFSNKKIIILEEIPKGLEDILPIITEIPPTNYFFITCKSIDKRSKIFNFFQKIDGVILQDAPNVEKDKEEIRFWCARYLEDNGASISNKALTLFLDKISGSLHGQTIVVNYLKLQNELDKILIFKDTNFIDEKDIELLVDDFGERNIFLINNFIIKQNSRRALHTFRQLLDIQGKKYKKDALCNTIAFNLLSMYKALFCMHSLLRKGVPDKTLVDFTCKILHSRIQEPEVNPQDEIKLYYYSKPQLFAIKKYLVECSFSKAYQSLIIVNDVLSKMRDSNVAMSSECLMSLLIANLCSTK